MRRIFFNILKTLDPEVAHNLTINALKLPNPFIESNNDFPILSNDINGLSFKNPIGMAAGFDKNAEVINSLFNLGFGFTECGTVTPRPQFGNAKPRVFRLASDKAIINIDSIFEIGRLQHPVVVTVVIVVTVVTVVTVVVVL